MTNGDQSATKHAPPLLCEQMTVRGMVEALERLQFNKREEARLVLDPGVQAFLIPVRAGLPLLITSMRKFAISGARSHRRDERVP
jgi:hypothetical protein